MVKKGRKAAENGSGDAPSAKRARTEVPEISGYIVQWEWEADKGKWTKYSESMNEDITEAHNSKKKMLEFNVGRNVVIQVKLDEMVQRNKKTGWERRMRCCLKEDKDFYIWQWQDEKGGWNPYSIDTCIELEQADGKGHVDFEACQRSYSIDVAKLEQTNVTTDVKRKVERAKSNAVAADPSASGTVVTEIKTEIKTEDQEAAKGSGEKSAAKVKKEPKEEEDEEAGPSKGKKVRIVVISGKAPVDAECTALLGKAQVYYEGNDIWDCMLNQTNVGNNNNKYYLIQLLKETSKNAYHVWQRWGRVGYRGQDNLVPCGGDLDKAKDVFTKKFKDKTKNDWYQRKDFEKVPGKYDLLAIDYGAKGGDETDSVKIKKEKSDVKVPDSTLDKRLQDLLNLICDVKIMEDTMREMKYDCIKAPLGKLTSEQIKAGYSALKTIDTCVEKGDFGRKLTDACNDFYTRIPHDFGMKTPPLIRDKETIKLKLQLLESLEDIEIAMKTLKAGDYSENPIDRHYHALKCEMKPMDKSSQDFKMINEYLQNTHATTHNQYKMQIEDVFELEKENEADQFVDHSNKMLLWHGSRLTNWVGILSKGLRIAPPEAPVTGYMFGKGVYFADMSSKSANYCFATRSKNVGLLLLCEVSLGNTNDLLAADYKADKLPHGKHSVKGLGAVAPDPAKNKTLPDGTVVPLGKSKNTNVKNSGGYTLNYNEFIVYDTKQIKMKYLVKTKFNFK
ncbi:poly [ADP-ribose] polymerase 2-like isoform X2 [Crassostrea virginica]|uniref:Poly [ADP-ribose] polymerase n=1 Tax=Crassostrea virginica TaxID=6565 RepID=A0A8B8ETJ6_CRAVI|nr:poly [ADP-ribose] polymerase 2-like isoform X2 [Crassostrea virginica]